MATPSTTASPTRTTLEPEIVHRQAFVGQVGLAPDGGLAVYTLRRVQDGRDVVHLWAVPSGGGAARALTRGAHRDTQPRFSPDGAWVAFVSDRANGVAQAYAIPLQGGEPVALTAFARGVVGLDWLPDGRGLVVAAPDDETPAERAGPDGAEPIARVIRTIDWREDGDGLRLHPSHLHLVPFRPDAPAPPRARRLTAGPWSATRPRALADGRVAFLADLADDRDLRPRAQVHAVGRSGGEVETLTDLPGAVTRFSVEPDGGLICVATDAWPAADEDPTRIFHVAPGGAVQPLSADLDRFAGTSGTETDLHDWQVGFDDAGRVTCVHDAGRNVPVRFGVAGAEPLVEPALDPVCGPIAAAGDAVVASLSLGGRPPELYALARDGAPRRLTRHGGWLPEGDVPTVTERVVDGPGGPIQTFVVSRPEAAGTALPTVLDVHGGPTGAWTRTPPLEALLLAAHGFRVLLPNIRGSYNAGRAWQEPLRGAWGGPDAEDCHAVLDDAVAAGLADPARLGCLGLSYGGFVVNWLVGTSDRFAAAVSENGVTNQVSAWANCDFGPTYDQAAGLGDATTPEGVETLWRQSPLRHVAAIRTPLLLLQAEADRRCPPADNEQLFVALRWLRRDVEYVLYPGESHGYQATGRPDRRIDRHRRVLEWFERHLRAPAW